MPGSQYEHETDRELLIRIDERVKQAVTTMEQRDIYHKQEMDRVTKLITDMVAGFTTTMTTMQTNFASKAELTTMRHDVSRLERTVYGTCGLVLVAFVGALITIVFKGKGA